MYIVNVLAALLTIAFGLFGLIAPRFTATALDLAPTESTMGLSEIRASVGGLFVVCGSAVIILNDPLAYAVLGFGYAGTVLGRLVSLACDAPPRRKVLVFGGIEAVLAAWLVFANLPLVNS